MNSPILLHGDHLPACDVFQNVDEDGEDCGHGGFKLSRAGRCHIENTKYFDHDTSTCGTCPEHSEILKKMKISGSAHAQMTSGNKLPDLHLENCECNLGSAWGRHRKPDDGWKTNEDGTLADNSKACCELPKHAIWKNATGCEFECEPGYIKNDKTCDPCPPLGDNAHWTTETNFSDSQKYGTGCESECNPGYIKNDGNTCTPCSVGKSDTERWKKGCETCSLPEGRRWSKDTGCENVPCDDNIWGFECPEQRQQT